MDKQDTVTTEIVGFSSLILSHLVGFHHNKNELPPFNESLRRCVFSRQLGGWHELDSGSSWTKNMSWQNWDPALTIQNSKFKWDKMRWTWDDIVFSHLVSSQYGTNNILLCPCSSQKLSRLNHWFVSLFGVGGSTILYRYYRWHFRTDMPQGKSISEASPFCQVMWLPCLPYWFDFEMKEETGRCLISSSLKYYFLFH